MARRGPSKSSFGTVIELKNGTEVEVVVEYSWSPSTPDVFYLSNGDPGYPGDPEEAEILGITEDKKGGRVIGEDEISEETMRALEEQACDAGRDEADSAYEAAMEARAEARAERDWDR
jgi:hypothetical protein